MNRTAKLGTVLVGNGFPVRVMAAVNLSPESFYKGSVATTTREISVRVRIAIEDGADIVDIGAMSTAPYLRSEVSEEVEITRIRTALRAVRDAAEATTTTMSIDTLRASVADTALKNGASVVNDVSGLKNDSAMANAVRDHGASLLAMAHSSRSLGGMKPIVHVRRALKESLGIAARAEIDERRIVLDPGIGFFREAGAGRAYSPQRLMPWHQCSTIAPPT